MLLRAFVLLLVRVLLLYRVFELLRELRVELLYRVFELLRFGRVAEVLLLRPDLLGAVAELLVLEREFVTALSFLFLGALVAEERVTSFAPPSCKLLPPLGFPPVLGLLAVPLFSPRGP